MVVTRPDTGEEWRFVTDTWFYNWCVLSSLRSVTYAAPLLCRCTARTRMNCCVDGMSRQLYCCCCTAATRQLS